MQPKLKKKKVLFLITKSNWGGAQRYVFDLATNLDPHHFDSVVALGGEGELKTKLEAAGIRTITVSTLTRDISLTKEFRLFFELWQILRRERPDVFHVNSSKAGGIGCFLGRLARVPRIIFTAHGWAFNEDRPQWQQFIIKVLHWLTVLLSHQTIAVSTGLKLQLDWPGAKAKMTVIPLGRTPAAFLEHDIARKTLAGVCPDLSKYQADPWLMIIAELHPVKRHVTLLTMMERLVKERTTLRLICIGDGQLRQTLEQGIKDRELSAHVFLTGHIPEASKLLKAATVFVLPSQSEAYGYVLHEAGLAGVPCVASKVGGIPDVITDGETGSLVEPNNPDWFGQAVQTYLDNPALANEHGQAARVKLEARTVQNMMVETTNLYDNITPSPTDSRAASD